MAHRRRAKAPKNTAKNTSKAPKEVDLTVKPTPPIPTPSTVIKQPKNLQTFLLNIIVFANTTKIFSNILATPFRAFKYQKFVT